MTGRPEYSGPMNKSEECIVCPDHEDAEVIVTDRFGGASGLTLVGTCPVDGAEVEVVDFPA